MVVELGLAPNYLWFPSISLSSELEDLAGNCESVHCNALTDYLAVSARSTSHPRCSLVTMVLGLILSRRAHSPMLVEIPFQVIILALE